MTWKAENSRVDLEIESAVSGRNFIALRRVVFEFLVRQTDRQTFLVLYSKIYSIFRFLCVYASVMNHIRYVMIYL